MFSTDHEIVLDYLVNLKDIAASQGRLADARIHETMLQESRDSSRVFQLVLKWARGLRSDEVKWELAFHSGKIRSAHDLNLPQGGSGLLQLPAELRVQIFEYALIHEEAGGIYIRSRKFKQAMALLQTCKQIRCEASPIFFKENRFLATIEQNTSRTLIDWLHLIEPENAETISSIQLDFRPVCNVDNWSGSGLAAHYQTQVLSSLKAKLKHTGLKLSSLTAPAAEKPSLVNDDNRGEFLRALATEHWQQGIAKLVADAADM